MHKFCWIENPAPFFTSGLGSSGGVALSWPTVDLSFPRDRRGKNDESRDFSTDMLTIAVDPTA
jgi:hypothetical protein